jgi:uncharacterized protein (TIGR04255 family)
MTKRYKNSPIIEAICEFHFSSNMSWDLTFIGLIYEKLKDSFPKKQQLQVNIALATTSDTNEQTGIMPMIPLVRFSDSNEKMLVQLGQSLLTINHLKPYDSWEEFLPSIEKGFKAYCEIANPKGLHHINIRYINRVEIPKSNKLEDAFQIRPLIPPGLPSNIESFLVGVNLPYEDEKDTLRLQLGTINPEAPDMLTLLLEIAYIFAKPEEIALDDVLKKVDVAHKQIEDAFERCLTDELKQTFGEVKE